MGILVSGSSSPGSLIFATSVILKYISRQADGKSIVLEADDLMIGRIVLV